MAENLKNRHADVSDELVGDQYPETQKRIPKSQTLEKYKGYFNNIKKYVASTRNLYEGIFCFQELESKTDLWHYRNAVVWCFPIFSLRKDRIEWYAESIAP